MEGDVFTQEMEMCRRLSLKNGGCAWGTCATCGVIPLLHKLSKGIVLEDKAEIDRLKKEILTKEE